MNVSSFIYDRKISKKVFEFFFVFDKWATIKDELVRVPGHLVYLTFRQLAVLSTQQKIK
jgi:hypothetical protein